MGILGGNSLSIKSRRKEQLNRRKAEADVKEQSANTTRGKAVARKERIEAVQTFLGEKKNRGSKRR